MVFAIRDPYALFHDEMLKYSRIKAAQIEAYGISVEYCLLNKDDPAFEADFAAWIDELDCDFLINLPLQDEICQAGMLKLDDLVRRRHIPNIFYNQEDKDLKRLCYVGCDYVKSGCIAAGLIALAIGGQGRVAALSCGADTLISFKDRLNGFKDELAARYPGIELVLVQNFLADPGREIDFAYLKAQQVQAVYLINPGDYRACPVIREKLGCEVKIITNDLLEPCAAMLKSGLISAVISQDPKMQAELPLDLAFNYLVSGQKPARDSFFAPLSILIDQCL